MGRGDVSEGAYVQNEVTLEFADGEYLFKLKLPQLAELQEKCNAGIGAIYTRVLLGEYRAEDLFESIRLGLLGGGTGVVNEQPVKVTDIIARRLVQRYCEPRPLDELHKHALAILSACVIGYSPPKEEGKDSGNAVAEEMDPEQTGSTSPPLMPME